MIIVRRYDYALSDEEIKEHMERCFGHMKKLDFDGVTDWVGVRG